MSLRHVTFALATLTTLAAPAFAKDSYVYGPAPDWDRYKALGEAAVRAELPDPANWQIEWPNGYLQAGWGHKGQVRGYLTCGVMRATGPTTSAYHPLTNFAVVIDQDQVKRVDISTRESNSFVNIICGVLTKQGRLPPASLMDGPKDLAVVTLGLTIRAMPEGAYVTAVAADAAAARAGLKPGMVITRANGIALAGMGSAMAKVLGGDVPTLAIETATGEHLEVRRAP